MSFQVRSDQALGQTGRIAAELLLDVCLQAQAMTPSCNMGTNKLSTKSTKLTGKTDSTSSLHLNKGRGDRVVSEALNLQSVGETRTHRDFEMLTLTDFQ